ncbi:uncharacterized protein LOC126746955 [Anthonomus grandis grandis]|uniref:uncharacterized protein LOC126746955 n=1 Tax=Anthonomus grandis grandis TaxID=2921223 RepID=UPI0021657B0C|nr:uncharacterized protein LOC126746955 [Anthonomus grandis grandis]
MRSLRDGGAFFGFFWFAVMTSLKAEEYNVFSESNSWSLDPTDQVERIFASLCENYHLIHENEEIDCANVRFKPKDPLEEDHVIRRREVDENPDIEGSGVTDEDGKAVELGPEPSQPSDEQNLLIKEEAKEEDPKENANQTHQPKEAATTPLPVIQLFELATETTKPEQAPTAVSQTPQPSEEPIKTSSEAPETTTTSSSTAATIQEPMETKTTTVVETTVASVKEPEAINGELKEPKELEKVEETETEKTAGAMETTKQEAMDIKTTTVVNDVQTTVVSVKEPEAINEEQSGNAVLLKAPKEHGKTEGSETEKVIDSIQSSAKETVGENDKVLSIVEDKNASNTDPALAESSKTVNRAGGKDATLLISLFVVVLVIGAAAFAHNYIKKRKQRAQEETNANVLKRTPATNGKNDTDIEQGTEMKPLMKNEVVKEYSDSKKEPEP